MAGEPAANQDRLKKKRPHVPPACGERRQRPWRTRSSVPSAVRSSLSRSRQSSSAGSRHRSDRHPLSPAATDCARSMFRARIAARICPGQEKPVSYTDVESVMADVPVEVKKRHRGDGSSRCMALVSR